ncbi:uncharacterized protein BO97DRAFT_440591 [Aspergillus homomorphus CBS 101889]|uniref:BRCT domain-containing protein n=1 Tax=Aspergillus homomorphus (strain CBS 101889) TaxID=1450537 RepID=A0A395I7A9_ASPHC|nr:hypothetical protein BO97DRAFT_440591 [Aspergillus homomorphus CBS 101889]RAL16011.1 hypothetical protein BO97DRAFT_440591 [Aspergillus homomorphus CBS 101889]
MARAAIIPQSPPKRTTRTRTKGSTATTSTTSTANKAAPKTTKARAPSSATEARKRGARTASVTTSKQRVEEDVDASTDDEIDMFGGSGSRSGKSASTTTMTTKPRGRPTTKTGATTASGSARTRKTPVAATTPVMVDSDSDNEDELAQTEAPKKRAGRPKAKAAAGAAAAPKTRGRPRGAAAAAAKPKVVDELKENTRLNARGFTDIDFSASHDAPAPPKQVYITTNSSSVRSNLLRGPAKKKTVTFQDPTETDADELDAEPSPPPAGRKRGTTVAGRQSGLASKPVRKPAATSGRGRKPAAAKKDGAKPLSPKKATQVAKGISSYASSDGEDDELSADKDQMKAFVQSPPKQHGSENAGLSSPVKKINLTGRFRKSLDENGEPLPGPRRSIDFNDNLLMSSPARRPPPSPFNFTMRETPKRGGGFTLRSDTRPLSQPTLSPTLNSPLRLSPKKANLETPLRGNLFGASTGALSQPNFTPGRNSPLKSSPRKGLFGASFMSQSQPEPSATPLRHSTSLLQSPAKKVATPFKASLSVMKSPVPEESEHENENAGEPEHNEAFDDSHVEESPLRLMQTRSEVQVEEDEDVASENDELDPVSTTPPHSPSAARHYESGATDGKTSERDSEETIEYVEDGSSTVAEENVEDEDERVDNNVEEEAGQADDQVLEEDTPSTTEALDFDGLEADDPDAETVDEPMEENAEMVEEAAKEVIENPIAEPIEEPTEKATDDSPQEDDTEDNKDSQDPSHTENHDMQDDVEPEGEAQEHIDELARDRGVSADETLDDDSDREYQEQGDDVVDHDQDVAGTVSDAEDENLDTFAQESAETPKSPQERKVEQPTVQGNQEQSFPGLRSGLVEGLEDVFVDHPTVPEEARQRLEASDTEDDPDMMETDDDVDAAEEIAFSDDQEVVNEDGVFEENEATIVAAETTELIPPITVPIVPYEVEEPENPWSPIREAYYRAMKNISPIRVLPDSPVRRNMSFGSTIDSPSPVRHGFTVDSSDNQDPFVDAGAPTPLRRRSIKRSIFDNAPRFTPLAQQFSQWKASSPARFQPRRSQRPRKGIFSLGGSRRSSSNAPRTPNEVTYPQINSHADTSEEVPVQAEDTEEEVPVQAEAAEDEEEVAEDEEPQIYEDFSQDSQLEEDEVVEPALTDEVVEPAETAHPEGDVVDELVEPAETAAPAETAQVEAEVVDEPAESAHPVESAEAAGAEAEVTDENAETEIYEDPSQSSYPGETDSAETTEPAEAAEAEEEVTDENAETQIYEDPNQSSYPEETDSAETTEPAEAEEEVTDENAETQIYEDPNQSSYPEETDAAKTTEPAEAVEQSTEVVDGAQTHEDPGQYSHSEELNAAETREQISEAVDGPQIYEDPSQNSQLEEVDRTENVEQTEGSVADIPSGTEVEATPDNYVEDAHREENLAESAPVPTSPAAATESFEENKENDVFSNIPLFTPVKNRIPQMQTVHTVSKVPLKPEGQISPLKISRKRGLSLSGASPVRASTRIRTSTFAPSQQTAPPLSPRKSPRLQRTSMSKPVAPVTNNTQARSERSTPAKRPPQSPSPTKSAKAPRRSMTSQAPKLALQGAVVYVDVHTTEGEDASGIFIELLQQMGARCIKNWSWNPRASLAPEEGTEPKEGKVGVTHVVFKDGGVRTLEKVRHARGLVKCVGVGWVLDCERENKWLDETPYAVDSSIIPRGGAKRRKSMEPRALSNVNGTLVKAPATATTNTTTSMDRRRSGIARSTVESFTREHTPSSREASSTPEVPVAATSATMYTAGHTEPDQHYCHTPKTPGSSAYAFDMDAIGMSPATPFYLSQRTKLVQQTCPPKQTRQGLFTNPGPAREPTQKLRSKLEAARRKSLAYKPRVGSPLVE